MFLGLGSNLGDSIARLRRALSRIERLAPVLAVSSFYRTDPVGHPDQPDFVNAVAKIAWPRKESPERLLEAIQEIERSGGRVRRFRNGPREIDVDILDFGGVIRNAPDPVLPHPRMEARRFVLAPLAEIAPRWRHPISGKTAKELMRGLPAKPGVVRIRTGASA